MALNIAQYSKYLKILTLIPITVGFLTFAEAVLPYKSMETRVVEKSSSFRVKTGSTTYTIAFTDIDDQFTEEIYNSLSEGDKVTLYLTYFNKQIREVVKQETEERLENSTAEPYALYAFGLVFLLTGLVWFKYGNLSNKVAYYIAFAILISIIQLIRMF